MLGRRNLRIKVMQTLYAREMDTSVENGKLENQLKSQIQRSVNLYLTDLLYLVEVCSYSMVDKAKRLAKFIKTEEDLNASTTIAANAVVKYLQADEEFNNLVKKEGIRHYIQDDLVKSLFTELSAKEAYRTYAAVEKPSLEQDKEIIGFIFKKIFSGNKNLEQHLEETFINYDDDQHLLLHILYKYTETFSPDKRNFFQSIELWEEEKQFAFDLLNRTIEHNQELTGLIEPNLKNWEMDRIAILDLILMKMALCELKYFPTVPVKVSINEYIDISKMYSTPKSKDFVNGVLDKTKNQLLQRGDIKKYGRGLLE